MLAVAFGRPMASIATVGSKPDASPPDYQFRLRFSEYSGFVGCFCSSVCIDRADSYSRNPFVTMGCSLLSQPEQEPALLFVDARQYVALEWVMPIHELP